jgi:hypothetical protein
MTQPLPDLVLPDRRDTDRVPSGLPISVDGRQARLRDLSTQGVGFETSEPPAPGEVVALGMRYLPDDLHPPLCEAEVVRVEPRDDGVFKVGARLVEPRRR